MNKPSVAPLLAALAATIPEDKPTDTMTLPFYNTGGAGYPFGISKGGTKKKYGSTVLDQIEAIETIDDYIRVSNLIDDIGFAASNKTHKKWMKALFPILVSFDILDGKELARKVTENKANRQRKASHHT